LLEILLASLSRIPIFDNHLLAEGRERGLDLHGFSSVRGIEHTADHTLVDRGTLH